MKPLKNLYPLGSWILRLCLLFYLVASFSGILVQFNLQSPWFWLSGVNLAAGFFLFVGGLLPKPGMTVLSSLIILLAALYQLIFLTQPIQYLTHAEVFMATGTALLFITRGNG